MNRLALLPAAVLALAACASDPVYGPAERSNDLGYRDQIIEEGRYRVAYRGNSIEEAQDGALRRASEIALADGADWFTVVNQVVEGGQRARSGSSIGIGGATGGRRSGVGLGVSLPLGGGGSGPVEVLMEVLTGEGEKPRGPQTYDARSVLANVPA